MCDHNRVVLYTSGEMRFIAWEVVDTQEDHLICRDCGEEMPENWFYRGEPEQEYAEVF